MSRAIQILMLPLLISSSQAASFSMGDYKLIQEKSKVSYHLVHKFHNVDGHTHDIEGRVLLHPESGELMIRITAGSFDSGNKNRDAHAKEVLEVQKFPFVVFKGNVTPDKENTKATVKGVLSFHGIDRPLELSLPYQLQDKELRVDVSFPIRLSDHQVERPQLLFVKVNDEIRITGSLVFSNR